MKMLLSGLLLLGSFSSFAGLCEFGKASLFAEKQAFSVKSTNDCICLASDTILPVDSSTFKVRVKYMEFPEFGGKAETVYKEKMRFNELVAKARALDAAGECIITEWRQ